MKKLLLFGFLAVFSAAAAAFEIYALGTSNTNCKGVDRAKTFTAHLEELLRADGVDARIINGGVDGDRPVWMEKRLGPR